MDMGYLIYLFLSIQYSVFSGSLLLSDDVCPKLDFVSGEIIKIQDRPVMINLEPRVKTPIYYFYNNTQECILFRN